MSDVGRYRLIAELARGGMGVVYLGLVRGPAGFNKLFVVKELKGHLAEDPQLVSLFLEEARISAKLSHPNVVQTIEVGSDGDRHFIAMEFLDGQSLNRILSRTDRQSDRVPLPYLLHILAGMLEGLEYAHDLVDYDGRPLGLVHRDVSPHNLFVGYDGQVKVLDFGIAKVLDSSHHTATGVLKGKIAYMSPEQASGFAVDRRSDVFAAGIMLWEAVAGERMWGPSPNDLQVLRALTTGNLPKIRERVPDVDERLARIIDRATAFHVDDRFATAGNFQLALEEHLRSLRIPRFGAREIGSFVGELFKDERRRIQGVVDDQLRLLADTTTAEYAALSLPRLSPNSGQNGTPSATAAVHSSVTQSALGAQVAVGGNTAQSMSGTQQSPLGAPRARVGVATIFAGVAVTILVLGVSTFFTLRGRSTSSASHEVAIAPNAPSSNVPSQPATGTGAGTTAAQAAIQTRVTVTPASATVSVDNGPAQVGGFAGSFVRDGAAHTLHLAAPGYQAKELRFAADGDQTFDIALEPIAPSGHSRRGSGRGEASSSTRSGSTSVTPTLPTPPVPTAPERNRQQIDTADPYAK